MIMLNSNIYEPKMYRHMITNGFGQYRCFPKSETSIRGEFDTKENFNRRRNKIKELLSCSRAFNISSIPDVISKEAYNEYNIIPPFPVFWIEGAERYCGKERKKYERGLLVDATLDDAGYHYRYSAFSRWSSKGGIKGPTYILYFDADEDGRLLERYRWSNPKRNAKQVHFATGFDKKTNYWVVLRDFRNLCNFLSIINAKNVSCPRREYDINKHTKRIFKSRKVVNRYHILKIHKPGEKIKKDSSTGENEGKMPLHVVRGHLRTYDEKGMFGKYYGTYFIPSHTRGDIENGTVTKDYALV